MHPPRIRSAARRVCVHDVDARYAKLVFSFVLSGAFAVLAEPRIPRSDDEVVERVADGTRRARALKRIEADINGSPTEAARLAKAYVELGRAAGDPRYMGRAQGVLAPWRDLESPPPEVLLMRAVLQQWHHRSAAALRDLDRLIEVRPADAQAWLIRANIEQVIGDYGAAARSCERVSELLPGIVATTCAAGVASLTGNLAGARAALARALDAEDAPSSAVEAWSRTALADMALRAADARAAEREFRRALALERDPYTLAALADLLLDGRRAPEVVELLRG